MTKIVHQWLKRKQTRWVHLGAGNFKIESLKELEIRVGNKRKYQKKYYNQLKELWKIKIIRIVYHMTVNLHALCGSCHY